jgi:hypothetical protein
MNMINCFAECAMHETQNSSLEFGFLKLESTVCFMLNNFSKYINQNAEKT